MIRAPSSPASNQGTGLPPQVIPATMAKIVQQGIDALGTPHPGGSRCHRGPLVNLWGFGRTSARSGGPSAEQIAKARERVGIDKLTLTPRGSLPLLGKAIPDLYLDLSTLGEGGLRRDSRAAGAKGPNYLIRGGGGSAQQRGTTTRAIPGGWPSSSPRQTGRHRGCGDPRTAWR